MLEGLLQFEDLVSDLFVRFGKCSHRSQVDQETTRALELIRLFFGAACCSLMEVL